MQINELSLVNYRSFSDRKIIFDKDLTVIIGKNGSGKSNLLEAIALIAGIRPLRVETELDLVAYGQESAKVSGIIEVDGEKKDLVVNFQIADRKKVGKSFYIDNFKKRLIDFVQIFSVIDFEPMDLDLVSGSPSLRRKHIDKFLSAVEHRYWRAVSAYGKIVARRNKVLLRISEGKSKPMELSFWDERFLEYAKYISKVRAEFFEYLNFVNAGDSALALGHLRSRSQRSVENFHDVRNSQNPETAPLQVTSLRNSEFGELSWELKQSTVSAEKLLHNRERDIAAGMTLSGPHRDDFRFIYKGRDLEFFGSRGQQRMAVLALKLAELEYFKLKRGVRPILALDDIFSELDWEHRETVLSVIGNQQTIITAAEEESVPKEIFKKAKVVRL